MRNKILVVEDAKNIALVIEKCLVRNSYEVYKASDGIEAMNKVFEVMPDLILLDIVIPKLNGYFICEALKSNSDISNIPVIVMSAKTQDADVQKAFDAGAVDYLTKPFTPEELLKKVKEYC